eukprot:c9722_g1_i1.p1 GENE.c9722_g1_i1~~c9722_g1_i1.p1  ORF type:complete len:1106 (+),score=230.15 c9722_g1_i1:86-3403(+)
MKSAFSYLKRPHLGKQTSAFCVEFVIQRIEGLSEATSPDVQVWVEVVRGTKSTSTSKKSVDSSGSANWNERLVFEKVTLVRGTDGFEPKHCRFSVKERLHPADTELAKKLASSRKISDFEIDLAHLVSIHDLTPMEKTLEFPLQNSNATLWITVLCTSNTSKRNSISGENGRFGKEGRRRVASALDDNGEDSSGSHSDFDDPHPPKATPSSFSSTNTITITKSSPTNQIHNRPASATLLTSRPFAPGNNDRELPPPQPPVQLPSDVINILESINQRSPNIQKVLMRAVPSDRPLIDSSDDDANTSKIADVIQNILAAELCVVEEEAVKFQRARRHAETEIEQLRSRLKFVETERQTLVDKTAALTAELSHAMSVAESRQEDMETNLQEIQLQLLKTTSELEITSQREGDLRNRFGELESKNETLERDAINERHTAAETIQRLMNDVQRLRDNIAETQRLELQNHSQSSDDSAVMLSTLFSQPDPSNVITNSSPNIVSNNMINNHITVILSSSDSDNDAGEDKNDVVDDEHTKTNIRFSAEVGGKIGSQPSESIPVQRLRDQMAEMTADFENCKQTNAQLIRSLRETQAELERERIMRRGIEETSIRRHASIRPDDSPPSRVMLSPTSESPSSQEYNTPGLNESLLFDLVEELQQHTRVPADYVMAAQYDPIAGALKALQYYGAESNRISELAAQYEVEQQRLNKRIQSLGIQIKDLQLERLETFAQVEADQRIANRRIQNLEDELHRVCAVRDGLTKRTHNLRVERDKISAQAKADHVVMLSTLNGTQTQLRQNKALCDSLRQKLADQHDEHQQKIQQMLLEQEVIVEQLKRIHDEYHQEETRLRTERDEALHALKEMSMNGPFNRAALMNLPKTATLRLRDLVDHFIPSQHNHHLPLERSSSVELFPPLSRNNATPPRPPPHTRSFEDTPPSPMKRQSRGLNDEAAVAASSKLWVMEEKMKRAESEAAELRETLRQTVDHLVEVISEKERVFYELKEQNHTLHSQLEKFQSPSKSSSSSSKHFHSLPTTPQSQPQLEANKSLDEQTGLIKQLKAEKDILTATSMRLGDHLCKVITERDDCHMQVMKERDELRERLTVLERRVGS